MTKNRSSNPTSQFATFRKLAITLSDSVGNHQIPIQKAAMHPAALITSDAIHYDLVKKLFRTIYRANHCYHLNASIEFHSTFDAIGKIHGDVVNSSSSDIDQVNLIHEIGTVAAEFFKNHNSYPSTDSSEQSFAESDSEKGTVEQFG